MTRGAPCIAQFRHQPVTIAEHLCIGHAQYGDALRFEFCGLVQVLAPACLRAVVTAIDFDREFDSGKIEVDAPRTEHPLALELACQRAVAQLVQQPFERGFGRGRLG